MENNILGNRIRFLRERENLNQLEFAKILNISNTTLSQYETGQRVPSDEIKAKIADFFGVTVDYLLGRTDTPTPADKEPTLDEQIKEIKEKFPNLFELLSRAKGPVPEILADQITDIAKTLLKEYLENEGKKETKKENK